MSYMPKSKSDIWHTPPELYDELNKRFCFTHDPCPANWDGKVDGLTSEWGDVNFVNPPYSQVSKWIAKAHEEWKKGKVVVMLINPVTDTIAFHKYIYKQAELEFIKGRVKFINPAQPDKRSPSPKPSMLVIFNPKLK